MTDAAEIQKVWAHATRSFAEALLEPDPVEVISGLIESDATSFLTGAPGVGKSFVAVSMAASVATGAAWCNRQVIQGRVLYVVAEDTPKRVANRFEAWSRFYGVEIDHTQNLGYLTRFDFSDEQSVTNLCDLLSAVDVSLVIIDTLFAASKGIDTESAIQVKVLDDALKRIHEAAGNALAVLIVAHSTKSDKVGIAGSQQLIGLARKMLAVTKQDKSNRLQLKETKSNHSAGNESLDLMIREIQIVNAANPVGVLDTCEVAPFSRITKAQSLILEALPTNREWKKSTDLERMIVNQEISRDAFVKARKALLEASKIESSKNGKGFDLRLSESFVFAIHSQTDANANATDEVSVRLHTNPLKGVSANATKPFAESMQPTAETTESELEVF